MGRRCNIQRADHAGSGASARSVSLELVLLRLVEHLDLVTSVLWSSGGASVLPADVARVVVLIVDVHAVEVVLALSAALLGFLCLTLLDALLAEDINGASQFLRLNKI